MRPISKLTVGLGILPLLIWSGSTLPISALAATKGSDSICQNLPKFGNQIDQEKVDRETQSAERQNNRANQITQLRGARDARVDKERAQSDEKLLANIRRLEALAKTGQTKQAIQTFRQATEGALTKHRATIDTAMAAFRSGVDLVLVERQTAIRTAADMYHADAKAALATATASCAQKPPPDQIATTLKTSLREAHQKLTKSLTALGTAEAALQSLIQTRQKAFQDANQDLSQTLDQARNNLRSELAKR